MKSSSVPRNVALLVVCVALVSAQTFQYSRGWTNGRKRGGHSSDVAPLLDTRTGQGAVAVALLEKAAGLLFPPCSLQDSQATAPESMQRFRTILESRAASQDWKGDASAVERRRRDAFVTVSAAPPAAAKSN